MLDKVTIKSWDNCVTYSLKRSGYWQDNLQLYTYQELGNFFEFKDFNEKVTLFKGMIVGWEFPDRYSNLVTTIEEDGTLVENNVHERFHFGVIEQIEPLIVISDLTRLGHHTYPYLRNRVVDNSISKGTSENCPLPKLYLKRKKVHA